ncbi:glycerol-3-phosphate 1-O-acyltransferase PlsY [Acidimicrobiia bacterium]|nr:glycerol-3-phosphate 1-O-acyltransferase PlsY [Acidimicrobiia bacterium]
MIYIFLVVSYLLGSINFAIILSKYKGIDIKKEGSGNPGSSNALRVLGKKYAIGVLIGDMLKGVICILFGIYFIKTVNPFIFGISSVLGHCFPVYYKFKGGKGVATFLGSYLGYLIFLPSQQYTESIKLTIFLILLFSFIIIAKLFRISALASLFTVALAGYFVISDTNDLVVQILTVLIIIIIIFQHRSNLQRLFEGDENKF